MREVKTAKDFGLIYNAYTRLEEEMITALSNRDLLCDMGLPEEDFLPEVERRLARLEDLIRRRPFIVAELRIKNQPNSCKHWKKYFDLERKSGTPEGADKLMRRAIATIDPVLALPETYGQLLVHFASQSYMPLAEKICLLLESSEKPLTHVKDHVAVWTCLT